MSSYIHLSSAAHRTSRSQHEGTTTTVKYDFFAMGMQEVRVLVASNYGKFSISSGALNKLNRGTFCFICPAGNIECSMHR
mmetsp:Transcript_66373/g.117582  ORF Transcript_66373/g.117582 Transcript_66373/m.117582 type:complete len:80 (-) Transcript_66373:48-287(-)